MSITSASIATAASIMTATAPIALISLAYAYFFRHPILLRHAIWERLMGRKVAIQDETLDLAVREQTDLNQARAFLPGYRFRNIYHARAVIKWCRDNEVGHEEIRNFEKFISYDERNIKVSEQSYTYSGGLRPLAALIFAAVVVPLALFALLSGANRAVLAVAKESGTLIFIEQGRIVPASLLLKKEKRWTVNHSSCEKESHGEIPLSSGEVNIMCDWISSGKMEEYIGENFSENFYALIVCALLFLWAAVTIFRLGGRYQSFIDLRKRISKRAPSEIDASRVESFNVQIVGSEQSLVEARALCVNLNPYTPRMS